MKLAAIFFIGLLLILAGIEGNLGSMLGAIIDPANMVEGGSVAGPPLVNTPTSSLVGGTGNKIL